MLRPHLSPPSRVGALAHITLSATEELKLGDFRPADAGQVKFYLRWLDRHERQRGEGAPVALILCAGRKSETVEYLELDRDNIHVAEYLTQLPPKRILKARFQKALAAARASIDAPAAPARARASTA